MRIPRLPQGFLLGEARLLLQHPEIGRVPDAPSVPGGPEGGPEESRPLDEIAKVGKAIAGSSEVARAVRSRLAPHRAGEPLRRKGEGIWTMSAPPGQRVDFQYAGFRGLHLQPNERSLSVLGFRAERAPSGEVTLMSDQEFSIRVGGGAWVSSHTPSAASGADVSPAVPAHVPSGPVAATAPAESRPEVAGPRFALTRSGAETWVLRFPERDTVAFRSQGRPTDLIRPETSSVEIRGVYTVRRSAPGVLEIWSKEPFTCSVGDEPAVSSAVAASITPATSVAPATMVAPEARPPTPGVPAPARPPSPTRVRPPTPAGAPSAAAAADTAEDLPTLPRLREPIAERRLPGASPAPTGARVEEAPAVRHDCPAVVPAPASPLSVLAVEGDGRKTFELKLPATIPVWLKLPGYGWMKCPPNESFGVSHHEKDHSVTHTGTRLVVRQLNTTEPFGWTFDDPKSPGFSEETDVASSDARRVDLAERTFGSTEILDAVDALSAAADSMDHADAERLPAMIERINRMLAKTPAVNRYPIILVRSNPDVRIRFDADRRVFRLEDVPLRRTDPPLWARLREHVPAGVSGNHEIDPSLTYLLDALQGQSRGGATFFKGSGEGRDSRFLYGFTIDRGGRTETWYVGNLRGEKDWHLARHFTLTKAGTRDRVSTAVPRDRVFSIARSVYGVTSLALAETCGGELRLACTRAEAEHASESADEAAMRDFDFPAAVAYAPFHQEGLEYVMRGEVERMDAMPLALRASGRTVVLPGGATERDGRVHGSPVFVGRSPAESISATLRQLVAKLGDRPNPHVIIDLAAHGTKDGELAFVQADGKPVFLPLHDFRNILNEFPGVSFTVFIGSCYGALPPDIDRLLHDPAGKMDGRITLITQTRNYETLPGGEAGALYMNIFTQLLATGLSAGLAHVRADREVRRLTGRNVSAYRSNRTLGAHTATAQADRIGRASVGAA